MHMQQPNANNAEYELRSFLVRAKRATFAGDGPRTSSPEPGGREYVFADGEFRYRDRYFGWLRDIGQEIVWLGTVPRWGMNYMGGMLPGYESLTPSAFSFLKQALLLVTPDVPLRGPAHHNEGRWLYEMTCVGDLDTFQGDEAIFHQGEMVYSRRFFGGTVYYKRLS